MTPLHAIENTAVERLFISIELSLNAYHPHLCKDIAAAAERFNIQRGIAGAETQAQLIFGIQLIQTCDSASRYASSLKQLIWGSNW